MFETVISKIESGKCKNKTSLNESIIIEPNNVVVEVKPKLDPSPQIKLSTSDSLKDKIEKLRLVSQKVKKPIYVESKKTRKIVELW